MKETRFIAQNKEKWQESENLLKEPVKDPEKLSNLFIQVIDDLSYSRTYYPNRSVRVFLNKIAREYFSLIYSHHRPRKNVFRHFWLDELPQIVCQSRRQLYIALIIFVFSMGIGVFSSIKDPEFATAILGERYVEMTKANIEEGDPMAVYKEAHQVEMFLGITLNNLLVAFKTYAFGVFFSIGTVAILLSNGIMVGCFQFFFIERGLLAESALTIWLHGTLEISSVILAGGAGLTLGSGLLFPGTYSRLQAFQLSAIRSLKLMLGITPVFVLAALIESFLTRYTDVPDLVRLLFIFLSAFFIVGYFVIYPWMKSRQGFDNPLEVEKLSPPANEPVDFGRIKNLGEIIRDSFSFYRKHFRKLFLWIVVVTGLMTLAEFTMPEERISIITTFDPWRGFFSTIYYAMKTPSLLYLVINSTGTSLILYKVFDLLCGDHEGQASKFRPIALLQTSLVVVPGYLLIFFLGGWGVMLLLTTWTLFLLLSFVQHNERTFLPVSIAGTVRLCSENAGGVFGLGLVLLLLSFSFLLIISAPLTYWNTSVLRWNFAATDIWAADVIRFVDIFLKLLGFNLVIPVFGSSVGLLYFSLREIHTASNLKALITAVPEKYSKKVAG